MPIPNDISASVAGLDDEVRVHAAVNNNVSSPSPNFANAYGKVCVVCPRIALGRLSVSRCRKCAPGLMEVTPSAHRASVESPSSRLVCVRATLES